MQKNNRLPLTLAIYVLSLFILSGLVRAFDMSEMQGISEHAQKPLIFDTNKIIDINLEYKDETQWDSVHLEDVEQ